MGVTSTLCLVLPLAAPLRLQDRRLGPALRQQAEIVCLLCSGMDWACMGPLLGLGSQVTGFSRALELNVTCSCVLTFSIGWRNQAI